MHILFFNFLASIFFVVDLLHSTSHDTSWGVDSMALRDQLQTFLLDVSIGAVNELGDVSDRHICMLEFADCLVVESQETYYLNFLFFGISYHIEKIL